MAEYIDVERARAMTDLRRGYYSSASCDEPALE
jgi:hypothetical protein